jgi:hypothetical protein
MVSLLPELILGSWSSFLITFHPLSGGSGKFRTKSSEPKVPNHD